MILITLIYVIVEGIFVYEDNGESKMDTIQPVNNWALGFGFSIYCFEGIGVILPI